MPGLLQHVSLGTDGPRSLSSPRTTTPVQAGLFGILAVRRLPSRPTAVRVLAEQGDGTAEVVHEFLLDSAGDARWRVFRLHAAAYRFVVEFDSCATETPRLHLLITGRRVVYGLLGATRVRAAILHPRRGISRLRATRAKFVSRGAMSIGQGLLTGVERRQQRTGDFPVVARRPHATVDLVADARADFDRFVASDERLSMSPSPTSPLTVVVPVHGSAPLTLMCLRSIVASHGSLPQVVVVVDDPSDSETWDLLDSVDGIDVVETAGSLGFGRAVGAGVDRAERDAFVILNNDVRLDSQALASLEKAWREGRMLVGGQIIAPDGVLLEAGSIVWADGHPSAYGRDDTAERNEYATLRPVDYASASMLLVDRGAWGELGGFDEAFGRGYFEDTDLCWRARELGYEVWYEPSARAVHIEHGTFGDAEAKALMGENHVRFVARHRQSLERQPERTTTSSRLAAQARRGGPKVLFIDDRVPDPTLGSGQPRAAALLASFVEHGAEVTMFPRRFDSSLPHEFDLGDGRGRLELMSRDPNGIARLLVERADWYDLAFISRSHNFAEFADASRAVRGWERTTSVFDAEAIQTHRGPLADGMVFADEVGLARRADAVVSVSDAEAAQFIAAGGSDVRVIPHRIDVVDPELTPGFSTRRGFLFVGTLWREGSPNVDSVRWMVEEVWPLIRQALPQAALDVVGELGQLGPPTRPVAGVTYHGRVADLSSFYRSSGVFVAPTRFAAGIPLKVIEAAGNGMPSVVTPLLAEQLGWSDGEVVVAETDPAEFASACLGLASQPDLWETTRAAGSERVARECGSERFDAAVASLLDLVRRT